MQCCRSSFQAALKFSGKWLISGFSTRHVSHFDGDIHPSTKEELDDLFLEVGAKIRVYIHVSGSIQS
jgi:hypothetical protein